MAETLPITSSPIFKGDVVRYFFIHRMSVNACTYANAISQGSYVMYAFALIRSQTCSPQAVSTLPDTGESNGGNHGNMEGQSTPPSSVTPLTLPSLPDQSAVKVSDGGVHDNSIEQKTPPSSVTPPIPNLPSQSTVDMSNKGIYDDSIDQQKSSSVTPPTLPSFPGHEGNDDDMEEEVSEEGHNGGNQDEPEEENLEPGSEENEVVKNPHNEIVENVNDSDAL